MLRLLFRLNRKISKYFNLKHQWFKLLVLRTLYPARFCVGRNLEFGRCFAVNFDVSDSLVKIGSGVQFRDYCQIIAGLNGRLNIGDNVFFNSFCSITCFEYISIGDNCQFGEGVKFYDHNHQYKDDINKLISEQGYTKEMIRIGNNCWFGSNVIILKGIEIGDNVVIGAGCIIYKSIPSNSVVCNDQKLIISNYKG